MVFNLNTGIGVKSWYNIYFTSLKLLEIQNYIVGLGRAKWIDMRIHKQDICFSIGMLFSMAKPQVVIWKINDGRVIPDEGKVGDE